MNAGEKNGLIDAAKVVMNIAVGLVAAEVYSGLAVAPALLINAAALVRNAADEDDAVEAERRAAECPAILAIPWPFIYIGSSAWIAAVARLRDSLPHFIDLEPVPVARRRQGVSGQQEERAAQARDRWDKLSDAQQSVLTEAGISADLLQSLSRDHR